MTDSNHTRHNSYNNIVLFAIICFGVMCTPEVVLSLSFLRF